ncbi:MAG TPA: AI-2E family transporter [Gemmatimonadaceae bacterium]|nr:AI-2E family transporter [Gemmatimonadaceae bacterium]
MSEGSAVVEADRPASARESGRLRAAESAMIVVAVLVAIGALWLTREVLVPITLALVLATVLRPVVSRLERWHLPAPAAAAIVVLTTLALVGGVGVALRGPVQSLSANVPKSLATARAKLDELTARLRDLSSGAARQQAPAATGPAGATPSAGAGSAGAGSASADSASAPSASPTQSSASNSPSPSRAPTSGGNGSGGSSGGGSGVGSRVSSALRSAFGVTTSLLTEIVEEILLVFFILAAGRRWMEKLGRITRAPGRERLWPSIAAEVHDVVARYLLVTLLINLGQAVVIGLALWAIGIPTPLLWGALTFVAEFVPYLGGIVMIALLTAVGLATSQGVGHALLAPASYLVVTTLQNNLVSPIAYGRGLRLNPTMILIGVMFWWMVWGVAGAFLAVPILASLRVLGSRIPVLEPIEVMLEE